jgi:hypothetical protein
LEEVRSLKRGNELHLPVSWHAATLNSGSVSSPSLPLNPISNLSLWRYPGISQTTTRIPSPTTILLTNYIILRSIQWRFLTDVSRTLFGPILKGPEINYKIPEERRFHLVRGGSLKSRKLIVSLRNISSGAVSRPMLVLDGYETLDITRNRTVSYTVLWGATENCHTSTGWCEFSGLRIIQRQLFLYNFPYTVF